MPRKQCLPLTLSSSLSLSSSSSSSSHYLPYITFTFISLTLKIFNGQDDFACLTSSLFIISPIGIFMTSAYVFNIITPRSTTRYTESLFAFLSFSGMLCFHSRNYVFAALIWALSAGVRSNGILFAGFFVYRFILQKKNVNFAYKTIHFTLSSIVTIKYCCRIDNISTIYYFSILRILSILLSRTSETLVY